MIGKGKILVTGAGGFLGGWLCEELVATGAQVVALDREYRRGARALALAGRLDLITADIEDFESVLRILNCHDVELIFHLAAQALVKVAARNPLSTFKANIEGTWNLLEAARLLGAGEKSAQPLLKAIIVASSDKAYGDQSELPYSEDFPMQGRYPYDVSKSCADLIARSYFHSYALPVCVTRCGNLFGGGDFAFSRVVPGTIKSVLTGERPVIRSDGTPVRDYVYVKDAADALILLCERMLVDDTLPGEAFNISNEAPISVIDMVEKILLLMNRQDLRPLVEGKAPLEIQSQYLSSQKMRTRLSWKPQFNLETGLLETIAWYREHLPLDDRERLRQLLKDEG